MCQEQAGIIYSASILKDLPAFHKKALRLTAVIRGIGPHGKESWSIGLKFTK
jgi:hypothetical protein